MTLVKIVLQKQ